jgi:hypothetical protein
MTIIDEYTSGSYVLLTELRIPNQNVFVIDRKIYSSVSREPYRFYIEMFDCNKPNELTYYSDNSKRRKINNKCMSCSIDEYVISLEHEITYCHVGFDQTVGKYIFFKEGVSQMCINDVYARLYLPENNNLRHYRKYKHFVYIGCKTTKTTMNVYELNLRTKQSTYINEFPKGTLYVTANNFYVQDKKKIYKYNRHTSILTDFTYNMEYIIGITDQYIYSADYENNLLISSIDLPNEVRTIIKFKTVCYRDDILCITQTIPNNHEEVKALVYKIRF